MKKRNARMKKALAFVMAASLAVMPISAYASELGDPPDGDGGGMSEGEMAGVTGDGAPSSAEIYIAGGVISEDEYDVEGEVSDDYTVTTADDGTITISGLTMTSTAYDYTGVVVTDDDDDNTSTVKIVDAKITLDVEDYDSEQSAGVAVAVDGSSILYISDSEITVNGAGRYTIAAYNTSTMVVNNSTIVAGGNLGADGATDDVSDPASNAALLVSGTSRSNFSIGASHTYYYNSACIAEGWAALSTDSATGTGLELIAYNTYAEATNGGYGTYADTSCRDYLYGVTFNAAELGAIISNNGEIYIGSGADAEGATTSDGYDVLAYNEGETTDEGSVIYGARNAVQMHSPDMMGEGTAGYQAVLTVENSTLTTVATNELDATSTYNYYDYGDAVGAYVDYVTGSVLLVKSTGAVITLNNVEMYSSNGVLIQSIINSDSMSRYLKAGNEGYSVDISMTDMEVEGDIVHDDYQREMNIELSNTTITGAITSATADSWYAQWEEYADDESAYWTTINNDTYVTEAQDTNVVLSDGSVWYVDDNSNIATLEINDTSSVVVAEGVTLTVGDTTYTDTVLTASAAAEGGELVIVSVTCDNDVTSTGALSTVTSVTYTYNGETVTVDAENDALTLVVDGAQVDLTAGATYTVEESFEIADTVVYATGGPSSPPWEGLSNDEGSVYYFRQALLIDDSTVVADGSVTAAITGGTYDDEGAEGVTVTSLGAHFNGIYVTGGSTYTLTDITVYAYGDGGDDFSGWGAAIMTDSNAVVKITGAYIETAGVIRTAIWVGGNSITTVTDSVIYAQETEDDYATYTALLPAMMKRVPFALGMEGTVRATNVLGAGQGIYVNSIIVSTGWGALSTDSGSSYATTGTYALDVSDSLAGIGTLYANDGEGYATEEAALAAAGDTDNLVVTKEIDGVYYALEVTGSGYVTYADAGVMNYYTDVEFYSPDYVQILASSTSSSTYESSYLYSERIAFMTQQAGGGTLTLIDSTVETTDALLQIKSGAANTGYTNFEIDNTTVTFSGDSVRTDAGILVELVESDDAGNPGVTTYTISDTGEDAELTSSSITDSNATLSNGEYTGDIWNSIYNYYQALNVTLENADLTGTVSSSVAVHVDPETGEVVENGTVLYAYTGSEEGDVANYLDSAYGTTGDYLIIGSFSHTANEVINNPINLTIDADSTWTVTGTGYLNSLTVDTLDSIDAEEAVTIYTGALTVAGEEQADGTYTAGNVTIVVEEIENDTEDTGVVAASQTYNNVAYTFYAVTEDGSYDSASVEVTTQNQPDGTVTGTITAADGYTIVSVDAVNATIEVADDGSFTLTPDGTEEITVTITVSASSDSSDIPDGITPGDGITPPDATTGNLLTIDSVTCINDVTSTGALSTVTSVTYTYNGETATIDAENGVLTLVVDGAQVDLTAGASYTVTDSFEIADTVVYTTGGPSSPPWEGLSSDEGSVYYFRQALLIDDSTVVADGSVTAAITGGTYGDEGAEGITVTSLGAHFNGIYVTGDSTYTLTDITVYAYGDGGDDFSGWGAAIMTDSNAVVKITGAYIETAGVIRTAIWVGGNSITTVTDSVIYAQETEDDYATYTALLPAMMKRVPFALGMEGTVRATNVLGAGQGIYVNSIIVSTGWGALSTDSGSSYATTGTYALDVSDSLAGIGTLYANDGEGYATEEAALAAAGDTDNLVVAKEIDGVYYALEVTGSGYVTYADAGVMNYYEDVEFYSPDYVQILASGLSSSTYESSYLYSERIAFMTQQAGGGTLTLNNSEVYTTDALLQIKSGAANTGYTNFVIDNTTVTFSGDSVRTDAGILVELVESDDAGNPGVTSYTINDVGDEAELTADAITDSNATLSNGEYTGDIWNSIYNNYQALNVTLENADLTGTVSSSVAVHVDPETGEVVENGTVLYAYTGSEEGDVANYLDSAYGTTGDYLIIGSFSHTASEVLNNPINLTIDEDSTWTVTGTGYLNTLTVDTLDSIDAEEAVTIYTGALTIAGEEQEDGTYTAGNVTIVVEEIVNDAEDTGIAASGQTYNNVPYTFYSVLADGTACSIASDIATVNQPDGTVWFTLEATTGYEIVSIEVTGATLSEDDSHYTLTPDGSDEIIVTITVQATGSTGVTGLANLGDGWALYAGDVVVNYTGLVYNDLTYGGQAGWYYVVNGIVDFSYSGLVKYDGASNGIKAGTAGWYYVKNAYVDFTYTGLVKYTASSATGGGVTGWYYVKNAYVDFTYTGLVKYTASSATGGGVTGWYYVKNAYVDFTYNGLASNEYGTWYVKAGNVKFSYSGTYTTGGTTYTIKSGKLVG